jgi:hypothetical protein
MHIISAHYVHRLPENSPRLSRISTTRLPKVLLGHLMRLYPNPERRRLDDLRAQGPDP